VRLGTLVRPFIWRGKLDSEACQPGKIPKDRNRALEFERNRIAVVMIRLARVGARKQPYYRIVVIEKDRARNEPATVELKHERVAYWRGVGAKFSPIVEKLVTKNPAPAATAAA